MLFFVEAGASELPLSADGTADTKSTIDDSFQRQSRSKANQFYIESIDGKEVPNSLEATYESSYTRGSMLAAMGTSREVPIRQLDLHLVGTVQHSAPIGYIFGSGSNFSVEGTVTFTPKPGTKYRVTGQLSEGYSAVWIEDIFGNVASDVIEKRAPGKSAKIEIVKTEPPSTETAIKPSREALFLNVSSGESVDLVVEKFGQPDEIDEFKPNFFSERTPSITYTYQGLGKIQFSARKSIPLYVERTLPIIQNDESLETLQLQLKASDGQTLQHLAIGWYEQGEISQAKLDLFAEKIWKEKNSQDRYTVDAAAWLCKILGKSEDPRYRLFLQKISQNKKGKKLGNYAQSSLKQLPDVEVDQFKPRAE